MGHEEAVATIEDLGHAAVDDALAAHTYIGRLLTRGRAGRDGLVPDGPRGLAESLPDLRGREALPGAVVPLEQVLVNRVGCHAREFGCTPSPRQR
jgi:hypothetical protein